MNYIKAVLQYLERQGYSTVDAGFYTYIDYWRRWYKGKVTEFHSYRQYNGKSRINRTRRSLGMAKKVCEDWANLELNEKVEIVIENEAMDKLVKEVLEANSFRVRGNQLLELTYALGTGAFVEYMEGEKVSIDYIQGNSIYPLNWDNGEITSCAFSSERTEKGRKLLYLNIHELTDAGYAIRNRMFVRNGATLTPTALPEGMSEDALTGSFVPLFQIIKPNIVNNISLSCPMGISVYGNAIDQMEGLDLIYDSYCNEFRLGKKRIIVPVSMAKIEQEKDGITMPVFDDNDVEFYAVDLGRDAEQSIQEINMELRADAHEKAIKTALQLLSKKCGLGDCRFDFEHGSVKTATEVISEKSELFQNLKKHELVLERALTDLVKGIMELLGLGSDIGVRINFDDSIIEDTAAERLRDLQEIRDGIMQKWEYRAKWYGESESEAKKMTVGANDNQLMGFGDE